MLFLTTDSILAGIFCPHLKFQLAVTYTGTVQVHANQPHKSSTKLKALQETET